MLKTETNVIEEKKVITLKDYAIPLAPPNDLLHYFGWYGVNDKSPSGALLTEESLKKLFTLEIWLIFTFFL